MIVPQELEMQAQLLKAERDKWVEASERFRKSAGELRKEQKEKIFRCTGKTAEDIGNMVEEFSDLLQWCADIMTYASYRYQICTEEELEIIRAVR